MKVADFQQTLRELCQLLEAAGGTKPVAELQAFASGLDKFKDQTLGAFTTLLGRVSEGGEVAPSKKSRKATTTATAKPPKEDAMAVAELAERLYNRASQGIDESELQTLRERLGGLTGDGLNVVAERLNFRRTSKEKTNAKLIDAIIGRIEKREGATIRRNVLDRPEGYVAGAPVAS